MTLYTTLKPCKMKTTYLGTVQKKFVATPSTTVTRRKIYHHHLFTEPLSPLIYSAKDAFAITNICGCRKQLWWWRKQLPSVIPPPSPDFFHF